MKTFIFAIVTVSTLAAGTAFGQSLRAYDVRSFEGQRELNRLMYGHPTASQPRTPEEAAALDAAVARNHIEDVRNKARHGYAEWSQNIARSNRITQTNAKRQALKIVKAEKMTGADADTFVAEFVRQAPVAK